MNQKKDKKPLASLMYLFLQCYVLFTCKKQMLNDGTSIVLFTVLAGMYLSDRSFIFSSFVIEFVIVSLAGVFIGAIFGRIVTKAVHITHHRQYQVMLSIVLAYGSFYIAEHLGVSGVLASVTAGLMLSLEFGQSEKEAHFRDSLNGFWDVIEPSILAFLFLAIGIVATEHLSFQYLGIILFIFISSLLVRYAVVASTVGLKSSWRKEYNWQKKFLLTFAGIKGTMSVALLLSLEADLSAGNHVIITLTFGTVLLSLCIQSLFIYPISRLSQKQ